MQKKELRNIYKEKRRSITAKDKLIWDDLLLIQLQKIDLGNIQTVFTYWPIDELNEPNTHLFSRYLEHMIPEIRLAYPVSDFNNTDMKAILTSDDTDFSANKLGIIEPQNGMEILPDEMDLILVPMLICDKAGHRVGYGKGFYDRFLQLCRKDALKVAFSYFEPVDKIEDTSSFDVSLNLCITPQFIYEFE